MPQKASLNRIGSKIKVDLESIRDRIPPNLANQLTKDPRGTIVDYKMTDGTGIGVVIKLSDGTQKWFFENEIS